MGYLRNLRLENPHLVRGHEHALQLLTSRVEEMANVFEHRLTILQNDLVAILVQKLDEKQVVISNLIGIANELNIQQSVLHERINDLVQ